MRNRSIEAGIFTAALALAPVVLPACARAASTDTGPRQTATRTAVARATVPATVPATGTATPIATATPSRLTRAEISTAVAGDALRSAVNDLLAQQRATATAAAFGTAAANPTVRARVEGTVNAVVAAYATQGRLDNLTAAPTNTATRTPTITPTFTITVGTRTLTVTTSPAGSPTATRTPTPVTRG